MIHDAARLGFEREAEAYDRGRPEYPREAVRRLARAIGAGAGRVVVDVGAGTGKLARALLPSGAELVAVEPVAAMRGVLEREASGVRVLDATAEALPLGDGSVDAIVAGQAFHWFDAQRTLPEFHRVLRPAGRLGLIWNRRRREQAPHRAIDEIIEPHRGDTPSHHSGDWQRSLEDTPLFERVDEFTVGFEQHLDQDGLVDRISSISFVGALEEGERAQVLESVRRLAADGPVSLSYDCETFVYARLDAG